MRRFLSLFTMLMLCGVLAFAQSRVVTGKVTDANGTPVSFASVKVKGSTTGVSADANGSYSLKVNPNTTLVISGAGYTEMEVPVGTQTVLYTVMEKSTKGELTEVVVTSAFGIKRTARGQVSNVQNVNGDQLNTIRQQNVNDALAGKVAGAQVRSQSAAKLGANNIIRLRGENSFSVGAGALYVVDGTIVSSSNDINVDDIEDVNVLQGPAAAALFGPQGVNGAIVINTKKARKRPGIGLEINSSINFEKAYILPNVQNTYAGGTYQGANDNVASLSQYHYRPGIDPAGWAALDGKYYVTDNIEDESWGPKMIGQEYIPYYAWYPGHERSFQTAKLTPQPTNVRDFFETGVTKVNNINFSKAGADYNVRLSYTNTDIKGLIPTSYLKRNNFNATMSFDLSNHFTVAANVNFLTQKANNENDDTYGNQSSGSFNQWFHRDIDMNILKDLRSLRNQYGQQVTWNIDNPTNYDPNNPAKFYSSYYWYSPYAWQDDNINLNFRNKLFGDASLTYKVNNDLNFKVTYRRDQLYTKYDTRQLSILEKDNAGRNSSGFNYWETISGRAATWQGYAFGTVDRLNQNIEFLGSYRKKIKSFNVGANIGSDIAKYDYEQVDWNSLGGLTVPDEFLVSNSKKVNPQSRLIQSTQRRSLFARADVGFKNYAFVDGSYRRDYSSTESKGDYIDSKAVGVSLVVSDMLKIPNTFLSYLKIRASIGQVVNTLSVYQNSSNFDPTLYPIAYNGSTRIVTEPDRLSDPSLHGNSNTEKELGLEFRLFKNRFGINATYWDRTNKDFPFDVNISPSTGYTTVSTNVGEVKKQGVEVQASLVPVRSKNIDWTINAAWGYTLKNQIVSIAPGITRTTAIANGQAGLNAYVVNEIGETWGQLIGRGILRDKNGTAVVDPTTGLYAVDPTLKHFGSVLPKYTGGVQNSFTFFKNFTLNVNIDYSVGGVFFSLSKYYGYATGLYAETAVMNDKGMSVRDRVSDGGGVRVTGVDASGKSVDQYVSGGEYFRQFAYGGGIVEPFVNSLTFVKLRELSFGYKLPVVKLGLSKYLQTAEFSIISRNPFLLYTKAKGFDPSEISTNYGEDGQLPGTRSMGVNLKLGF